MRRAAAGRALRHPARPDLAGHGAGEPRHAHDGGGEEGCGPAAQAHRADDPVLPAGAVRGYPRARGDPGALDAVMAAETPRHEAAPRNPYDPLDAAATALVRPSFFQSLLPESISRR